MGAALRIICTAVVLTIPIRPASAEPELPPIQIRAVRADRLVEISVMDRMIRPLVRSVPFDCVHGIAWAPRCGRWLAWGGDRPLPNAADEPELDWRPPRQTLALGRDGDAISTIEVDGLVEGPAGHVRSATWDAAGERVLVVASNGLQDELCFFSATGELLERDETPGTVLSVSSAGPGRWFLASTVAGDGAILVYESGSIREVALRLPAPGPRQSPGEVRGVAFHDGASPKLAVGFQVAGSDSNWAVAVLEGEIPGAEPETWILARDLPGVRALTFSPNGNRVAWVSPEERVFSYRGERLKARYEVLLSATPRYAPERLFDPASAMRFSRPEELTMLSLGRTIRGILWTERGVFLSVRQAGELLAPTTGVWWCVRGERPQQVLADDWLRGEMGWGE